jgi:hypothetical protein
MTRHLTWAAAFAAGALALAATAAAKGGHHEPGGHGTKVYRATLVKTAAADTDQLPKLRGFAQLVDGKQKNKISIHVRGLKPGETYPWHIHKAKNTTDDPCAAGSAAADPTPYGDWDYSTKKATLKANAAGNASAKALSATFDSRADTGAFYVNVHLGDGTVIACGVLHGNKHDQSFKLTPRHKSHEPEARGHHSKPHA